MMIKLFLLVSCILQISQSAVVGTAQGSYANNCVTCISNGYDFCTAGATMLTNTGVCCSGLVQYGDYCSVADQYCTSSSTGGTKYFWCGRDTTSDCGSHTLYLSGTTQKQQVNQASYQTCEYTISTTDAAQAQSASQEVQAFMNSQGQFEVISSNTNAQMFIFVIDQNLVATQYSVGQLGNVSFQDIIIVATPTGTAVSYQIAYGAYGVVAASLNQTNSTSSSAVIKMTQSVTLLTVTLFGLLVSIMM